MNGNIGLNTIQQWWGNQVFKDTLDWQITPLRRLEEGATFGCDSFLSPIIVKDLICYTQDNKMVVFCIYFVSLAI